MKRIEKTAFDYYMEDMKKYPVLSANETQELIKEYKAGNLEAREKLINHNQRLVIRTVSHYSIPDVEYLDLIQQGNIGLLKAIEDYDPERGAKLTTYMVIQIKRYIMKYLYDQSRVIRKPKWQQTTAKHIQAVSTGLEAALNRKPTAEEIAMALDISTDVVERIIKDEYATIISLDTPLKDDDCDLAETIEDENAKPTNETKMKQAVLTALSCLNDEDRKFIELYYGVNGKEQKSGSELAEMYNTSRQNICLKRDRILNRLRYPDYLKEIRHKL